MVFYKPSCIRELHFFNFELNWIYEMSTRHSFYSTLTLTSCAMHTRIQQNDSMQTGKKQWNNHGKAKVYSSLNVKESMWECMTAFIDCAWKTHFSLA